LTGGRDRGGGDAVINREEGGKETKEEQKRKKGPVVASWGRRGVDVRNE